MKERFYNIDLIRIIAMLMVLTLHCNLFCAKVVWSLYGKNMFFTIMEFICIVAVNLYVLISGYFIENSKFSLKKIINLEIVVIFYSVSIYLGLLLFGKIKWDLITFSRMFFPILNSNYWFYTCYIALYCLMPILKRTYKYALDNNYDKYLLIIFIIITSILPSISPANSQLTLAGGYSYVWFVTLVFCGAYLKNHKINLSLLKCFILYVVVLVIQLTLYYNLGKITFIPLFSRWQKFLYSYNNIFVLINSILIFNIISNFRIKKDFSKKIINYLSVSAFSIYLIHIHPLVMDPILSKKLDISKYSGSYKIFIAYFAVIILLFVICTVIDKIRIILFKIIGKLSLFKLINNFIGKVDKKIDLKVN